MIKELVRKIEDGEQALSFTAASRFMKSPAQFVEYKTQEFQQSPSMIEGIATHALCLEVEKFAERFYVGNTIKDDKRQRLTATQYSNAMNMAKRVTSHHKWANIIKTANRVEQRDEVALDGFKFRRVLDIDAYDRVYDIKTMGAADISPRKWKWKVYDFNYHVQAAIYVAQYPTVAENLLHLDLLPAFYWIAVTKTDCVILECHKDFIRQGFDRLAQFFDDWRRCIAADAWDMGSEFYLSDDELVIRP